MGIRLASIYLLSLSSPPRPCSCSPLDRQASLRELARIKGMSQETGLQIGATYWHITFTGPGDRGDQGDQDVIDLEPLDRKSLTASAEAP